MKNFLILLITIFTLQSTTVFATSQYIEFSSGEQDDGSIYLDSYEDYLDAIGEINEQELYKEEYEAMLESAIGYFETANLAEIVKGRVLTVEKIEERYFYGSYGINKIKYQPITVQILEGEHKGETYETSYVLTADTYENLKIKEIKVNQKINIIFEDGVAYVTTVDAAVDRIGAIITIAIITVIFIAIYLGKKGLKLLPQLILLADIILLIFVPELLAGRSILWLTIITSLLYMIVETVIKVGLNGKTIAAIFSSIAVTITVTLGLMLFGNIVSYSGITYEITNIIEAFPKGTIDFYMLNLAGFILMAVIVVSDISCKTVSLYVEETEKNAKAKIKDYVSEKIPLIFGIILIGIIPKYLYTLIAKYTFEELINSEIITIEIVRILFLIIAATLTTQVAVFSKKLFVEEK